MVEEQVTPIEWTNNVRAHLDLDPLPAMPAKLSEAIPDLRAYRNVEATSFVVTDKQSVGRAIMAAGCGFIKEFTFVPGGVRHWEIVIPTMLWPWCLR